MILLRNHICSFYSNFDFNSPLFNFPLSCVSYRVPLPMCTVKPQYLPGLTPQPETKDCSQNTPWFVNHFNPCISYPKLFQSWRCLIIYPQL